MQQLAIVKLTEQSQKASQKRYLMLEYTKRLAGLSNSPASLLGFCLSLHRPLFWFETNERNLSEGDNQPHVFVFLLTLQ